MIKALIFDFDLTLYDSSSIKPFMDTGQWPIVYKNIHNCSFYNGAIDTLKSLKKNGFKIAIVSNAPRIYITKVLSYYDINIDYLVCYHDVQHHKPNPQGIYQVLNYFRINNKEALYIGDNDIDYNTAYNAQVQFFGVPWGRFSMRIQIINFKIIKESFV